MSEDELESSYGMAESTLQPFERWGGTQVEYTDAFHFWYYLQAQRRVSKADLKTRKPLPTAPVSECVVAIQCDWHWSIMLRNSQTPRKTRNTAHQIFKIVHLIILIGTHLDCSPRLRRLDSRRVDKRICFQTLPRRR